MRLDIEASDLLGLSAAVDAASRAGIWSLLASSGPLTDAELCARLRLSERGWAVVAAALVAVGLLQRGVDDRIGLGGEVARAEAAMPGAMALGSALFSATPSLLATGAPPVVMDGDASSRAAAYRGAVGGLAGLFERAAAAFAEAFGPVTGALLDVGCGSGVWSLALAQRNAGVDVTGLDLPGVVEVFEAHAARSGLADRCRTVVGDAHVAQIPEAAFDVVLIANVLRLESPERAASLVARAARALRPGGRMVVIDALATGDPAREVGRSVYGLHLALRTAHGRVHPPEEVADWLRVAGLSGITPIDFGVYPGAVAAMVGASAPH